MYFDRIDICAAYLAAEYYWHSGGILWELPSCQRRGASVGYRVHRLGFRPGASFPDNLSENAQAIYDALTARLFGEGKQ